MALSSAFRIGLSSGSMVTLNLGLEPKPDPMAYAEIISMPDGSQRELGFLNQVWHWDFLKIAQANLISAFDGKQVIVETFKNDDTWGLYTCLFLWPRPEPEHQAGRVKDINSSLVNLLAYTE